jgi:hypothetical protein
MVWAAGWAVAVAIVGHGMMLIPTVSWLSHAPPASKLINYVISQFKHSIDVFQWSAGMENDEGSTDDVHTSHHRPTSTTPLRRTAPQLV